MTFLTQQQEVAARAKMDNTVTAENTLIERWINAAQAEIWAAYDWPWARDREIVRTVIDKTAGTVDVSAGGTTVTGTSTAFAAADVGKFIQFSDSDDWYKITAVASAISLTIEASYAGTSALDDGTYTIRQMLYTLSSSVEKILDIRQAQSPVKLTPISFRDFHLMRPNGESTGKAQIYAVFGIDSSDNWQFMIYPHADVAYNLEEAYKTRHTDLSADADVSDIPTKWQPTVMIDGALARAYEHLRSDFNDTRPERKRKEFLNGIEQMISECEPENEDFHHVIRSSERPGGLPTPRLPEQYDRRG